MIGILRMKRAIQRWAPSCQANQAEAGRTQHFNMYRLPFHFRGITSPELESMRHQNRLPTRDSNPMSAHLLRLNSPLCTSATCIVMFLTLLAPSVHISRRRSPRLGIDAPLGTSYGSPKIGRCEATAGMPGHIILGMTVSHAPKSAMGSTSIFNRIQSL